MERKSDLYTTMRGLRLEKERTRERGEIQAEDLYGAIARSYPVRQPTRLQKVKFSLQGNLKRFRARFKSK